MKTYPIDRSDHAAARLVDVLRRLGIDAYGRPSEDVADLYAHRSFEAVTSDGRHAGFEETDRGVRVYDEKGTVLLETRSYWWGDDDDPEVGKPNLEVPSLGLEIDWYKYALRGAYTNQPLTDALMDDLERLLRIPLDCIRPYVAELRPIAGYWFDHHVNEPGNLDEWTGLRFVRDSGETPDEVLRDGDYVTATVVPYKKSPRTAGPDVLVARVSTADGHATAETRVADATEAGWERAKRWCRDRLVYEVPRKETEPY